MNTFKVDDFVWRIDPAPPYEETQWRIVSRESDPKREPPIKWRCGRTNDQDEWEEKVFRQEELSHHRAPAVFG